MIGTVTVVIVNVASQIEPPSTHLEFEVQNHSDAPIWLVDDGWLIWRQTGKEIELSYARGVMQPGTQVFGYFSPSVVKIDPGNRILHVVHLTWPQPLDRLWNAEPYATPTPGEYRVSVHVGYGVAPEPDLPSAGEGVESPIFRWQREASSESVSMQVPPYSQAGSNSE